MEELVEWELGAWLPNLTAWLPHQRSANQPWEYTGELKYTEIFTYFNPRV
jgi:hypothetical protein